MPTTLASVTRLPVRLLVLLETLTSPCKYQIGFSYPDLSVNTYPSPLGEVCMRSLQNEGRGNCHQDLRLWDLRVITIIVAQSCVLRVNASGRQQQAHSI